MLLNSNQPEKKVLTPSSSSDAFPPVNTRGDNGFVSIANKNSVASGDSNFVFFFGKPAVGKSVILASMLYYMNAQAGTLRPRLSTPNTKEAEVLLFDMLDNIRRGILPRRTTVDQVTRLDLIFEPNNKSKKVQPINLTFLEMSGENLQQVRRGGSMHRSIDEFLNASIPLNFFLVTDFENADDDDSLMIAFLNELEKKTRQFKKVNAILIVAKWDKSGDESIHNPEVLNDFVATHMPMTNNQVDNYELSKTFYTVGRVLSDDEGNQRLSQLNLETAQTLTEWLYQSITGVDMHYEGTFWERLFGK